MHKDLEKRAKKRYKEIQARCGKHMRYLQVKCEMNEAEFISYVLSKQSVIEFYDKIGLSWSVDRIDPRGNYSLDNIQIISLNENSSRVHGDYDWQKTMKSYVSKKIGKYKNFSLEKFDENDIVVVFVRAAEEAIRILDSFLHDEGKFVAKHFVIYSREGFRVNVELPPHISLISHNNSTKRYDVKNLPELKSAKDKREDERKDKRRLEKAKREKAIKALNQIPMPKCVKKAVMEALEENWPIH